VKSYRQLREKWLQSFHGDWQRDSLIDIFKNPTKKEILEAEKNGSSGFRGVISPNGDLYVWGIEFHSAIIKKVLKGKERLGAIPIRGISYGQTLKVIVSPVLQDSVWDWYNQDEKLKVIEIIKNQTQLKRHFNKITVNKGMSG